MLLPALRGVAYDQKHGGAHTEDAPVPGDSPTDQWSSAIKRTNIAHYDDYSSTSDVRARVSVDPSKIYGFPRRLEWISRWLDRPGMRVLDAGSGVGMISTRLRDRDMLPVCLDISLNSVRASTKYDPRLEVAFVGDCESMALRGSTFDAVVFNSSLHHLSNVLLGLAESFRVLRSGGYLLLVELNSANIGALANSLRGLISRRRGVEKAASDSTGRHLKLGVIDQDLTLNYVLKLARHVGFRILEARTQRISIAFVKPLVGRDIGVKLYQKLSSIDQGLVEHIPVLKRYGSLMLVAAQK